MITRIHDNLLFCFTWPTTLTELTPKQKPLHHQLQAAALQFYSCWSTISCCSQVLTSVVPLNLGDESLQSPTDLGSHQILGRPSPCHCLPSSPRAPWHPELEPDYKREEERLWRPSNWYTVPQSSTLHTQSRSGKQEMKNQKLRISLKPDQKSTTTYMLKQWTLVKPLPLAARLLRHAPDENGSALVARNQGQESSLVSVGVERRRSWVRRAERCGMRARCHGSKLGFVEMGMRMGRETDENENGGRKKTTGAEPSWSNRTT